MIKYLIFFFSIFAMAADLGDVLPEDLFENLNASMEKVYPAVITISWMIGYGLIIKGILMLKKLGHKTAFMGGSGSLLGPIAVFFIAVMLINAQTFINIIVMSIYDSGIQSTKVWSSSSGDSDSWFAALKPMIGIIQVIGIIAFLRGALILVKACNENSQPGNIPKGLMHVFGGVMAVNITGTIDLVNSTLGFS